MSVSINQMIRAMHKARHEIEINQIGGLSAELAGIFDAAERKLYRERERFFRGLTTNSRGEIIGSVKNIEAARKAVVYVKGRVDKLVKEPGIVWGDKMVNAMGEAGRELARVNLTTDFVPQAKIDAVFKHVSSTERAILRVGRSDAHSIIGTIGDDINEFFRREMLDSVAEGIPVQGPGDSLANRLFASGRLKAIPVYTKDGRTIMRSARTRADAIARVESAKILNATHEDVTKQALGDEAVYRNSNPRDSRTTDICSQASRQEPMTLLEWSRSRFGRPPRLRPFHLCRSVLIGGMPEWFEDDGNPEPVQDATPPPQPDNPKIKGPQDFDDIKDRLDYYAEGDNIARDIVSEAARRKRRHRKLSKEYGELSNESNRLWDRRDRGAIEQGDFDRRLKQVEDRKNIVFDEMDELENGIRDYAARVIGNEDEILVGGLPFNYKRRPQIPNFDPEAKLSLNNLLKKQSGRWPRIRKRFEQGRDFVNRLVHRGDSDLPKGTVTSRRSSSDFERAEKVLKKNLDDGYISQEKYDAELKAIAAVRAELNKWKKSDRFYQPSLEQSQKLRDLFKKAGWSEVTGWSEVEITRYAPFKGIDYDIFVSDRKGEIARAFEWNYPKMGMDAKGGWTTEARKWAEGKDGMILMDKGGRATVMAHELGHLIEGSVSGIREACARFLSYRTRGEKAQQLNKVFPNSGYDDWEVGKKDKFDEVWKRFVRRDNYNNRSDRRLAPSELANLEGEANRKAFYTGKEYNNASEILSMGLQLLYEDPVTFARYDLEYFKFIVGILRGDLRYY